MLVTVAVMVGVLCAARAEPPGGEVPAAPLRPVYLRRVKVRGFW